MKKSLTNLLIFTAKKMPTKQRPTHICITSLWRRVSLYAIDRSTDHRSYVWLDEMSLYQTNDNTTTSSMCICMNGHMLEQYTIDLSNGLNDRSTSSSSVRPSTMVIFGRVWLYVIVFGFFRKRHEKLLRDCVAFIFVVGSFFPLLFLSNVINQSQAAIMNNNNISGYIWIIHICRSDLCTYTHTYMVNIRVYILELRSNYPYIKTYLNLACQIFILLSKTSP